MKRLLEQAQKVLSIPSPTASGNEELVNSLSILAQGSGLEVKLQHVLHSNEGFSKRQFNLVGILGDPLVDRKIKTGLLLLTHLDTTPAGRPQNWATLNGEPYRAKPALDSEGRERMVGVGAADAKIDFLCKLRAIQKYRESKLRMPIYLVGTCGEEAGQLGAKYLIQSHALNPKYVLVGKPTDLKVVHTHKSSAEVKVSVGFQTLERGARGFNRKILIRSLGRAHHSAFGESKNNALLNLIDLLNRAMDSGFDLRMTHMQGGTCSNQAPDLAVAECYLTSHQLEDFKRFFVEYRVRQSREEGSEAGSGDGARFELELGGLGETGISFLPQTWFKAINDIVQLIQIEEKDFQTKPEDAFDPAFATISLIQIRPALGKTEMILDWRLLPNQNSDEVFAGFSRKIFEVGTKYKDLNLKAEVIRMNPSFHCSETHEWIKNCGDAMERAGLMPNLDASSLSSEAGLFAKAGFDVAVFGPGVAKGNIHGPDESILVKDIERAVVFYEKIIEKVCL